MSYDLIRSQYEARDAAARSGQDYRDSAPRGEQGVESLREQYRQAQQERQSNPAGMKPQKQPVDAEVAFFMQNMDPECTKRAFGYSGQGGNIHPSQYQQDHRR